MSWLALAALAVFLLANTASVSAAHTNPLVVATIPVDITPWNVAVNPNTDRIYVLHKLLSWVTVIDGTSNAVLDTIAVPRISPSDAPRAIAVNPTTNRVYAGTYAEGELAVIDGSIGSLTTTIALTDSASDLAVNPVTNLIYVSSRTSDAFVIDGDSNSVIATLPAVGTNIAVNPITNRIYLSNFGTVTVVDGETNSVIDVIEVPVRTGIAVNPDTNIIYFSIDGGVAIMDGNTNGIIATVPVVLDGPDITVNPATNHIYVSNRDSDSVSVIDGTTNSVVATVLLPSPEPFGSGPFAIAVNPNTDLVYTANFDGSDTVSVIDSDSDVDGAGDTVDPCPADPDCDGDSNLPPDYTECQGLCPGGLFRDGIELFVGTDPLDRCANTVTPNDEDPDAWPPDFNDDQLVSIADVLLMKANFGAKSPDDALYDARRDLNADGKISISDVLTIKPFFGAMCS